MRIFSLSAIVARTGIAGAVLACWLPVSQASAGGLLAPTLAAKLTVDAPADTCGAGNAPSSSRSLAKPVACTFTNPRGSFGATTSPPAPPPVVANNDPTKPPPTPPGGTATTPATALAGGFAYHPPGELVPLDKGRGRVGDRKIYLPGIIFPLKLQSGMDAKPSGRHAFMNSQIWGYGGGGWNGKGAAGGSECDARNYDPMQQRDNFCEVRGWDMPMCPAGQGHQGQDIRPPGCDDDKWDAVAVADGTITQVTSNTTVRLKGGDGTEYYYLHMHPDSITVEEGAIVKQGQVLGRISNFMNGGRQTTHHLHFQVKQSITIGDSVQRVYVPVFASLVAAYRRGKGLDPGVDDKGHLLTDAAYEVGAKPGDAPKPPFTLWPVVNIAGFEGRPVEPVNLARAFRPADEKMKVTYAAAGLPANLALDSTTGLITGNLEARASKGGANGVFTVTATATDAKGAKASQSFTITANPSTPVVAVPTTAKTFREGDTVVIAAGAAFSDPNLNALTFSATGLPAGWSLDPATGRITGVAPVGGAAAKPDGVYVVNMTASDNIDGTATQSFTITILPLKKPDPPVVPPPVVVGPIPQVAAFAGQELTAIDTARYFAPAAGDTSPLQYTASGMPPGLSIDAATGQIKGLLPQSAADGKGEYPVVVTVSNAAGSKTSQSFLLTVRNQAPAVVTQTVNKTYVEGEQVQINAGGAFAAPAASVLKFTATGLPDGLVIDARQGLITGSLPPGSARGGANGTYTIGVTAEDQRGAKATQTFTLTVGDPPPRPQPPVVTQAIAPLTVKDGEAFAALDVKPSFKVAGTPGSIGPLQYAATGLPAALTIDAQTGIISGKLAADASKATPGGNYLATLFAKDAGNGLTATLALVLTVQPQAVAPPAPPQPPVVSPPVTPPVVHSDPPKPDTKTGEGWWPWMKDKVSGGWGWVTK